MLGTSWSATARWRRIQPRQSGDALPILQHVYNRDALCGSGDRRQRRHGDGIHPQIRRRGPSRRVCIYFPGAEGTMRHNLPRFWPSRRSACGRVEGHFFQQKTCDELARPSHSVVAFRCQSATRERQPCHIPPGRDPGCRILCLTLTADEAPPISAASRELPESSRREHLNEFPDSKCSL